MAPALTRVLIVEDNPLIGLMTASMVEDLGYCVIGPMATLDEALERAEIDEVDFALLDFDLGGGVTAEPVCDRLRARSVPFAFTSGSNPDEIRKALGDVTIISKPVVESELEGVLP
jgi:CheY-like chemotaxis protein